jgi:hypothetical protein
MMCSLKLSLIGKTIKSCSSGGSPDEDVQMRGTFQSLGCSIALTFIFFAGALSCWAAETVPDCGGLSVRFEYNEDIAGAPYPSMPVDQQAEFEARFCKAAAELTKWFTDKSWLVGGSSPLPPVPAVGTYRPTSQLQIFVAIQYDISQSLVPAWLGQRGRMQFPSVEAVAGQAAAAHELAMFFFPVATDYWLRGSQFICSKLTCRNRGKHRSRLPRTPGFQIMERTCI